MKALLTLVLIFSIGTSSMAQVDSENAQTEVGTKEIVTVNESKKPEKKEMARVYLYKNSRVKKELNFKTKKNKSKLA